jgi:transcription elongation GreA/GreB family factor
MASKKFNELKEKLKNVDKDKAKQLIGEIKQAREDGKIDENEKKELLSSAKSAVGDNLGGLFK